MPIIIKYCTKELIGASLLQLKLHKKCFPVKYYAVILHLSTTYSYERMDSSLNTHVYSLSLNESFLLFKLSIDFIPYYS